MASLKTFEELDIWQKSRKLATTIWDISKNGSLKNDYGLKNQINRSTGSVMDNIAEGFGRKGNLEFVNFLSYSKASNDELRSQIHRLSDRSHINKQLYNQLLSESNDLSVRITNFMNYLNRSEFKGIKFRR